MCMPGMDCMSCPAWLWLGMLGSEFCAEPKTLKTPRTVRRRTPHQIVARKVPKSPYKNSEGMFRQEPIRDGLIVDGQLEWNLDAKGRAMVRHYR